MGRICNLFCCRYLMRSFFLMLGVGIDLWGDFLVIRARYPALWQGPTLILAFLFLAVALSHILPVFGSTPFYWGCVFFTCILLVSAFSHELIYRNAGTTYAVAGTGGWQSHAVMRICKQSCSSKSKWDEMICSIGDPPRGLSSTECRSLTPSRLLCVCKRQEKEEL